MTDATDDLLPEGLGDRLPGDAARFAGALDAMLRALDSHGFDRVDPPLIEFERSIAGRMANNNDGVETRRMFRFVDPASYRTLALRSDITPQIGRLAATSLSSAARPLRLCYCGPVVTMKPSGLNPAREKTQIGAELIGIDSVAAASELVRLAVEALSAAGATGISVDLTMPDLVDVLAGGPLPLDPAAIANIRRELDAKDAGGLKAVGGEAFLPLIHATGPFATAIDKLAAFDSALPQPGALTSRIDGLRQIAAQLPDTIRLTLDPTERHGFEYQSWFGFTLYAEGVRGALGRGGTYTIQSGSGVSAEPEPATGFTLYPDALADVLQPEPRDLLFLPLGHDEAAAATLRASGWRTRAALCEDCDAAALGCTHVLDGSEPTAL